jgi:hypothetical protein
MAVGGIVYFMPEVRGNAMREKVFKRLLDGSVDQNAAYDFIAAAMKRIEWLESQIHAPGHSNTVEWQTTLKEFLGNV